MILPDGEQYKSLTVLDTVFTALLKNRMVVILLGRVFGGGVIGDLTGFAGGQLPARRSFPSSANYLTVAG